MQRIPPGRTATLEVVVTDEMTVRFDQLGPVHPVYATYWMAKHMEEAGRLVLLPYLETGEDGVGGAVSVEHLAPALPGERLTVLAHHEHTSGRRIECRCVAHTMSGRLIGTGTTVQHVVSRADFDERLRRLRAEPTATEESR